MLSREVDAERFAKALRFVVTRPRPGAGDVAPVGLRSRDVIRSWIAVNLAAGVEKHAFDRLALALLGKAVIEEETQSVHIGLHRLDGILSIEDGRRNRSGVDQVVGVAELRGKRTSDVMLDQPKIRIAVQRCEPVWNSPNEVIKNRHVYRWDICVSIVPV